MKGIVDVNCDYCKSDYKTIWLSYYRGHQINNMDCCSKCTGKKSRSNDLEKRAKIAFDKLNQICNDKGYILKTQMSEFATVKMDIEFICPKHDLQKMILDNMLHGHGCILCSYEKRSENKKKDISVIKLYMKRHGNTWLNSNEYIGATENNLHIKCICGNIYYTSWSNYHSKDIVRCPTCSQRESKAELFIREYLTRKNLLFIQEKRFDDCKDIRPLPFDFYLPDYNLVIEFDGQHHYYAIHGEKRFQKTQQHDLMKNEYCKQKGIELLRIPYWEGHNIEQLIQNKIDDISRRYSLVS